MTRLLNNLLAYRDRHLKDRKVYAIARSLGALSKKWLRKDYPFRKKALRQLVQRSRFSEEMAEALLNALFRELTPPKLLRLLKSELRDPLVLDGFRRDPISGRSHRAEGPRLITHIFSGNVPNPAILSFILGMLVKSANLGKVSSKDEGFLEIYLKSLKAWDRRLAGANVLLVPKDKKSTLRAIRTSGLVIAYGGDESLKAIRSHVPITTPFVGYGHRISFGIYAKEALNKKNLERSAKKTAQDIWMADQRGCLSPSEIFIEAGGEVPLAGFSGALARAMERSFAAKAWRLPAGPGEAELIGFGARKMVRVRLVRKLEVISKILRPFQKYLQAVSLEAGPARRKKIADHLSAIGVNRICRAGQMQRPPITWHHDGKPNLASWLAWTDMET